MSYSLIRFTLKGWIEEQYVLPKLYFPYYGFEWVQHPGALGIYCLFGLAFLGATGILLGYYYRLSAIVFFLSFTYIELIDKTNYLNHYYFVSIVAFLIIWLPLNGRLSIDVWRGKSAYIETVPAWMVNVIKLQLAIVYCYAGMAKLNHDWMIDALPLKIWLKAHVDFPLLGVLLAKDWVAYFFSWFGVIYDLSIVFFLMYRKTRPFAYFFVVSFHLMTWLLFPIGVFPWVMIAFSTIFLNEQAHEKILRKVSSTFHFGESGEVAVSYSGTSRSSGILHWVMILFMAFQLLFPWRYLLYPGNLFWTEEGYRFSWRVMLMEKAGYATFYVTNPVTSNRSQVRNSDYLTQKQEIMMVTQPDMIWQYAQILEKDYQLKGIKDPIVTAEVYVTLNGRRSQQLIDPRVDLTTVSEDFAAKNWILSAP